MLAEVDHARRTSIRAHHSATHLLHEALRRRLGTHVTQKGSLNAPDRLRFDISQPRPMTGEDIAWVEAEVNARVRENTEVTTRLMTPDAAVELGAMALFGEKYGEEVRVVAMGARRGQQGGAIRSSCAAARMSGAPATSAISRSSREGAVAAGVRRIEAVTGAFAEAVVAETQHRLNDVAGALRASPADAPERVAAVQEDRRRLERQVAELQRKLATGGGGAEVEEVNGVKLAARNLGEVPARDLKGLADAIGKQLGSGVVALVSTAEGKASIVVGVSQDLTGRFNAVELVRAASAAVGGKGGGGRPDMAQAGGPDGAQADAALAAVREAFWRRRTCGREGQASEP